MEFLKEIEMHLRIQYIPVLYPDLSYIRYIYVYTL